MHNFKNVAEGGVPLLNALIEMLNNMASGITINAMAEARVGYKTH
jgi:hypothetical protein